MTKKEIALVLAKQYCEIRMEIKQAKAKVKELEGKNADHDIQPYYAEIIDLRTKRGTVRDSVELLGISHKKWLEARIEAKKELKMDTMI